MSETIFALCILLKRMKLLEIFDFEPKRSFSVPNFSEKAIIRSKRVETGRNMDHRMRTYRLGLGLGLVQDSGHTC